MRAAFRGCVVARWSMRSVLFNEAGGARAFFAVACRVVPMWPRASLMDGGDRCES